MVPYITTTTTLCYNSVIISVFADQETIITFPVARRGPCHTNLNRGHIANELLRLLFWALPFLSAFFCLFITFFLALSPSSPRVHNCFHYTYPKKALNSDFQFHFIPIPVACMFYFVVIRGIGTNCCAPFFLFSSFLKNLVFSNYKFYTLN